MLPILLVVMKILCKERDYYDHVGADFGYDKDDICFDRRNMRVLKSGYVAWDADTIDNLVAKLTNKEAFIGVWLGYTLYVFNLWGDKDKYENGEFTPVKPTWKWYVELIATHKCYDLPHKLPIEFVKIDLGYVTLNKSLNWKDYRKGKADTLRNARKIEILRTGNPANWKLEPIWNDDKLIILKNSWVPKFVSAKDAYYNIEEWLLAQKNDVDQESKGLTDLDKVENHGFDKKVSFRNVK